MTYYEERKVSLKLQKLSLSTFFHVFFTHEKNTVQSAKQLCLYNVMIGTLFFRGIRWMYFFRHCVICGPSDSTVSEDAGIEPRTVANLALAVQTLESLGQISSTMA
jgi:hypothetical protein